MLAWGWRRILVAFLAGAVSTLALAPLNFWPAPFLTFPILVWLIDGSAAGRLGGALAAAGAGWWFGFGYFVVGLYWIGNALLVDAKTFGWLLPFAVVALPAGLALFTALGTGLARWMWGRGPSRILALAVGLTVSEWLRGHVLTGFPWNAFGYALASPLPLGAERRAVRHLGPDLPGGRGLCQSRRAGGRAQRHQEALARARAERGSAHRPWRPTARSGCGPNPTAYVDDVRLRIMQPNLQQDEKFNFSQRAQVMSRYLALSDRASGPRSTGIRDVTHLIWPESAFPFFLTRDAEALAQIAALLPAGTVLITGAVRAPEGVPEAAVTRAYNSVYVIDHAGSILSIYDKVHLVPFGEYLPFQDFLEQLGLRQITNMRGGFIPGDRRRVLNVPRAPDVLPLICYEIIFPEAVPRGERPGWMVNLTNDGWFGASPGPYQHLQQARLRAIEQGLPLVRAANTGISAVVDPFGRIVDSLPLGTEGVLDARLPQPAPLTPYARMGDLPTGLVARAGDRSGAAPPPARPGRNRSGRLSINSLYFAALAKKFSVEP